MVVAAALCEQRHLLLSNMSLLVLFLLFYLKDTSVVVVGILEGSRAWERREERSLVAREGVAEESAEGGVGAGVEEGI